MRAQAGEYVVRRGPATKYLALLEAINRDRPVDRGTELSVVLTSLFLTQFRIEQARRDDVAGLIAPTPN